ncbi:MAG: MFS transporter [Ilumatobacter sp.]|uniref:MFS transporter n=1 Tax=Ilumatobacter sp. TaxID=1967498 RepID=UPI003C74AE0B
MPPERRELVALAVALVLAMSTWFSTAAVLGQLRSAWALTNTQASWLTIVVQIGFVVGAVVSSSTNLADRIPPLRLILIGASGAAVANASIVALDAFEGAVVARFMTGAFLALVYPPALKSISGWFIKGRGVALGVMIAALTIGSALPHLINALGGLAWQATLLAASALTITGGLIADRRCLPGPHTAPSAPFDPQQIGRIVRGRDFRLASAGYFGHMWELYAMWAWIAAFYGDVFSSSRVASLAAFAAIGSGAAGSMYAGLMSDRRSRPRAAGLAMKWSAALALTTGFVVDAPWPVPVAAGLVWGFWVVADSAQFSAIVTESCDPRYAGTALTMQLAAGFVLTVFTIFLVPVIRDAAGWGWAFALLVPGPVVGAWAMHRLERAPTAAR